MWCAMVTRWVRRAKGTFWSIEFWKITRKKFTIDYHLENCQLIWWQKTICFLLRSNWMKKKIWISRKKRFFLTNEFDLNKSNEVNFKINFALISWRSMFNHINYYWITKMDPIFLSYNKIILFAWKMMEKDDFHRRKKIELNRWEVSSWHRKEALKVQYTWYEGKFFYNLQPNKSLCSLSSERCCVVDNWFAEMGQTIRLFSCELLNWHFDVMKNKKVPKKSLSRLRWNRG